MLKIEGELAGIMPYLPAKFQRFLTPRSPASEVRPWRPQDLQAMFAYVALAVAFSSPAISRTTTTTPSIAARPALVSRLPAPQLNADEVRAHDAYSFYSFSTLFTLFFLNRRSTTCQRPSSPPPLPPAPRHS